MQSFDRFILDPETECFEKEGIRIPVYSEYVPSQHQGGVTLIMRDERLFACGDVRFEPTPGQFQAISRLIERKVDPATGCITATLHTPDTASHMAGFNPSLCPDHAFDYAVKVTPQENALHIQVDLSSPVPERFANRLCFSIELFPGSYFDRSYMMDDDCGFFPRQPNGPVLQQESKLSHILPPPAGDHSGLEILLGKESYSPIRADDIIAAPYAEGHRFTACPEDRSRCFTVISPEAPLRLIDGRLNHNNGWFVLCSPLPTGKTEKALEWTLIPAEQTGYRYSPVVHVSQAGYLSGTPKLAYIEVDPKGKNNEKAELIRLGENGGEVIYEAPVVDWGRFMCYRYLIFDFSAITSPGLYQVSYAGSHSSVFKIGKDTFDRGVWQPVIEYFLPVQMCHMLVKQKYRVWHGRCHMDDAVMAPVSHNHFDGYRQGPKTLTAFQSGDAVPGLACGGWHDAGDYDLRVESQTGECYIMALAKEEFGVSLDSTSIDQKTKTVQLHQPDGKDDILQQIEHGLLSVLGGFRSLGRLYRGIICRDLRQYVLLGDASVMTDGIPGTGDERWVFTEDNPMRVFTSAAHLAASARVLKGYKDELAKEALNAAETLFINEDPERAPVVAYQCAVELFLTTGKELYRSFLLSRRALIKEKPEELCWVVARVVDSLQDEEYRTYVHSIASDLAPVLTKKLAVSPFGVVYQPRAWGNGWAAQIFGCRYYYLHKAFPDCFDAKPVYDALCFVLGCHPGSNTASFASGIGVKSLIPGYCTNRADFSYIPGGVSSGTELIAPDFPELKEYPYLWQQGEYVLGGGSTRFMFLVLAAIHLSKTTEQ